MEALGGEAVSYERGAPVFSVERFDVTGPRSPARARRTPRTRTPAPPILSHRMYPSISFSKSTPQQNRQLIVYYYQSKY